LESVRTELLAGNFYFFHLYGLLLQHYLAVLENAHTQDETVHKTLIIPGIALAGLLWVALLRQMIVAGKFRQDTVWDRARIRCGVTKRGG